MKIVTAFQIAHCRATRYNWSYRDKDERDDQNHQTQRTETVFEKGTTKGIRADHVDRLRDRLTVLDAATCLDDIAASNWDLHPLTGKLRGRHAIKVSGNWRLFFEFRDGNVYLLDYDDYH